MSQFPRVQRAITDLVLHEPFYGSLALQIQVVEDPTVKTFCTDGKNIRYNPTFAATLKPAEMVMVVAEEVLHNAMGHLWRAPQGCDWRTWNAACDTEIRHILIQANAAAKGSPPFPIPDPEHNLPDPKYAGQSAEHVYWDMRNRPSSQGNQQTQPQPGTKPGNSSGAGNGNSPSQQPQKPQPGNQPSNQPGNPSAPGAGGDQPASSLGEFIPVASDEAKQLQADWERAVILAARASRNAGRGHLPGQFEEILDRIVNPKQDWRTILRDFIRESAHDDYDWMRLNPHFADSGFMLPSLHSMRVGTLVFAKDTSGSISSPLLAEFLAEEQSALDEMNPVRLVDICADHRVHSVNEYTPGDTIDNHVKGRGGTSFVPIFEEIATWPEPPVALVYLTDMDGTFPSEAPDYPVLWIAYDSDKEAPFGRTIHVEGR